MMEFGVVDDTALKALEEYVKRTNGGIDNQIMRQVAKEFGVSLSDMNKKWRYIRLSEYPKGGEDQ